MTLSSMQNPKIKQIVKLKNKRERDKLGLFVIEGYRECLRALEAGVEFIQFFYSKDLFLGENEFELINRIHAEKFEVASYIFEKCSYRDRPDGLLAIAKIKKRRIEDLEEILKKEDPLIVIAEAIEKPGNLGSMLRTADATGCDALIVCNQCTDIYNPNVVRSSTGMLFSIPVFELDNQTALHLMKKYQIQTIATTPHTDGYYYEINFKKSSAILVGTEQLGLSDFWINNADIKTKIPMLGKADSLNVSNATTVMLYEVVRQRRSI